MNGTVTKYCEVKRKIWGLRKGFFMEELGLEWEGKDRPPQKTQAGLFLAGGWTWAKTTR